MTERTRLQRKKTAEREPAPQIVHDTLAAEGQPLDPATRAFMEPRLGHDFEHVRVHTDGQAAESAEAVSARAYTVGSDVVFGEGEYVPGTSEGQRLLAHELAHVVQQSTLTSSSRSEQIFVSPTNDRNEQMADMAAAQVIQESNRFTNETGIEREPFVLVSTAWTDYPTAAFPLTPSAPIATLSRKEKDFGEAVDDAGQQSAEAYAMPAHELQVASTAIVRDENQAKDTLRNVQLAAESLQLAIGKPSWGQEVTEKHSRSNQEVINQLQTYLTYVGEESRTTSDFQGRYIKSMQQFTRLSGMVQQYSATSGTDISEASALIEIETGGTAKDAGNTLKRMKASKGGGELREAHFRVKSLRREAARIRTELSTADWEVLSKKKECLMAASKIDEMTADEKLKKSPEDSGAVSEVKNKMKHIKEYLSMGTKILPLDKLPGGSVAKGVAEKVVDVTLDSSLEEIYRDELSRAKSIQEKALSIVGHAQEVFNTAKLQEAANKLVVALETQHSKADEFDNVIKDLREAIRSLGDAADESVKTGGYKLMAQFLSEAEVFLQDIEMAISSAKIENVSGSEVKQARGGFEGKFEYYEAVLVAGRYEIIPRYVRLIPADTGSGGVDKITELMLKDLENGKQIVAKYHAEINKALDL